MSTRNKRNVISSSDDNTGGGVSMTTDIKERVKDMSDRFKLKIQENMSKANDQFKKNLNFFMVIVFIIVVFLLAVFVFTSYTVLDGNRYFTTIQYVSLAILTLILMSFYFVNRGKQLEVELRCINKNN